MSEQKCAFEVGHMGGWQVVNGHNQFVNEPRHCGLPIQGSGPCAVCGQWQVFREHETDWYSADDTHPYQPITWEHQCELYPDLCGEWVKCDACYHTDHPATPPPVAGGQS